MLALFGTASAQVLITKDPAGGTPDPTAILEVRDTETGILFPRVALTDAEDATTVPNPIYGLTVFDTNTNRLYFWDTQVYPPQFPNPRWIRNFRVSDAEAIIQKTSNFSQNSTSGVSVNSWPSSPPSFTENSGTTGWTNLNVSVTVSPTSGTNDVFISAEGMAQLNNTTSNFYSFAIGLFVDGQLKIVRKFINSDNAACSWKKFEINGLFKDMSPGNHTVSLYARNLRAQSNVALVYGDRAPNSTCSNMNENMARIFLTAQLTE
ncbi:MAG: hypothetical protein PHO74_00350 [Weeksellaceae bacterium]|nr:hypothetical protein [Weeksellaceae bacterium]